MASITVRNLDEGIKSRLRVQAAVHGRSMEDEVREILRTVLTREQPEQSKLGSSINALFQPLGGLDLPEMPRDKMREPPNFD